jgi:choline dehydrogenase-like flavoprotein
LRFGVDPAQSVLDIWCRAHDIHNLYVVDSSFLPSAGAVNTSLTVMAQALRVADHIHQRLLRKGLAPTR